MAKLKKGYLALIMLFLYAPIFVLIAQSFNASRYRGHWTGFTWEWYGALFENEDILAALLNTLSPRARDGHRHAAHGYAHAHAV